MSRRRYNNESAGRTPGLASTEPGARVEKLLVSKLQIRGEAEVGYAKHDSSPAETGDMLL